MCENWNSKLFVIVKSIQYKPWTDSANITILTRYWNFILHQFLFLVMNVLNYVKLTRCFFFLVTFGSNNLSFIIVSKTIPTHLENSHQNIWYYQTGEYVEVLHNKTLCTRYIIDFAVLHMFNFHILFICFPEVRKIKLCCK